ncbi:MAG TPA: hypothetical protein VKB93_20220, partial [Thermoanaerobaculia bacterium]|nr:hypothetical protein [Thermoanaerobaculia bacterium]
MNWKTSNYLLHRWIGITLGVMTFVWFGSGIAMMYYPWPAPTASEELARRPSFAFAGNDVIGFDSAIALTHDS